MDNNINIKLFCLLMLTYKFACAEIYGMPYEVDTFLSPDLLQYEDSEGDKYQKQFHSMNLLTGSIINYRYLDLFKKNDVQFLTVNYDYYFNKQQLSLSGTLFNKSSAPNYDFVLKYGFYDKRKENENDIPSGNGKINSENIGINTRNMFVWRRIYIDHVGNIDEYGIESKIPIFSDNTRLQGVGGFYWNEEKGWKYQLAYLMPPSKLWKGYFRWRIGFGIDDLSPLEFTTTWGEVGYELPLTRKFSLYFTYNPSYYEDEWNHQASIMFSMPLWTYLEK